jgi:hypothetical protein
MMKLDAPAGLHIFAFSPRFTKNFGKIVPFAKNLPVAGREGKHGKELEFILRFASC